jgi:hypothetical protein
MRERDMMASNTRPMTEKEKEKREKREREKRKRKEKEEKRKRKEKREKWKKKRKKENKQNKKVLDVKDKERKCLSILKDHQLISMLRGIIGNLLIWCWHAFLLWYWESCVYVGLFN